MSYLVRTAANPQSLGPAMRAVLKEVDKDQPLESVATLADVVEASIAQPRFQGRLLAAFSALALVLSVIGIYGVLAYSVAERTHEIGIRMALGAQKRDVLNLVMKGGMSLTVIGVGVGVAGAMALTRFLSSLLYGVKPTDPLTFVVVSLVLIGVALLACYVPARRATKADPIVALRYE
jgi:putative ABC transport system permease protein